jgi:hypothetical protein
MIKISLSIMAVYLIYYIGNMVYDLYFQKESKSTDDDTHEFSLSEISETYEKLTKSVRIEDVENIKTPKSFNTKELVPVSSFQSEERPDLHYLKSRFDSDQSLTASEMFLENELSKDNEIIDAEQSGTKESNNFREEVIVYEQRHKEPIQESGSDKAKDEEISRVKEWKKMLNLSETLVQLVANYDGHKVYHSTM